MTSLFLGVPFTRPHANGWVESLMHSRWPEKMVDKFLPGLPVDVARNVLVTSWELYKTDFLLFTDNDASFSPGAVMRLINHNLPVVCGGMYTRTSPPRPTMAKYAGTAADGKRYYKFAETARRILHYYYKRGVTELKDNAFMFDEQTPEDLYQIDACGMHFTLIRRDVLEKVKPPWFKTQGNTGAGEDFYFCEKAQAAGFQIYTDFSIQTGHCVGDENDLGLKDLMKYAEVVPQDRFDAVFSDSFQGRLVVG